MYIFIIILLHFLVNIFHIHLFFQRNAQTGIRRTVRSGNYHSLLPDINLPLNLPPVQHQPPHSFSVKDHHLLKPPPVMGQGIVLEIKIYNNSSFE